ncbi:universal stress protein [Hyphomicrobium sp. ghe19]|uniref:universal stress protein n=1 Tax=Hyphomicrobium sp. ghe19 TaxID=2682968 RepID=UPI0013677CE7|nr:hypothetical protein HYPP_02664 [Hyphomicrobium sp. ghe19]
MIKDVMVSLDGSAADQTRLHAAESIADLYDGRIIGLFVNLLPALLAADADMAALGTVSLIEKAKKEGDRVKEDLTKRLIALGRPVEIRRFDAFIEESAGIAAREARSADAFVGLLPNESREPNDLVESVLFGSGRHLFLAPHGKPETKFHFESILIAWNGSREATRALAEAMPYMRRAKSVEVVLVSEDATDEPEAIVADEVLDHLEHHGIPAELRHIMNPKESVGKALLEEARRRDADVLVMGGYGHSRLREWLLGGVTYELLNSSSVPLIIAH